MIVCTKIRNFLFPQDLCTVINVPTISKVVEGLLKSLVQEISLDNEGWASLLGNSYH